MAGIPGITLTLVIGQCAQAWHLQHLEKNLTETVCNWRCYDQAVMPLPHPSPRYNIWLPKNSWFEREFLAVLRSRVNRALM